MSNDKNPFNFTKQQQEYIAQLCANHYAMGMEVILKGSQDLLNNNLRKMEEAAKIQYINLLKTLSQQSTPPVDEPNKNKIQPKEKFKPKFGMMEDSSKDTKNSN